MTDRTRSLVVALDEEYREDDAQVIINAIKMIKGVLDVKIHVFTSEDRANLWAAKREIKNRIIRSLLDELNRKEVHEDQACD